MRRLGERNMSSKLKIIADTHTHTFACDHAYSTIGENAAAAAKNGLSFLAITEHCPSMLGAPSLVFFFILGDIPRVIDGVTIIMVGFHKGANTKI
ncbi:hypothetical protein FACS1894191_8740 [Clostridia bacterium]|nr:hypothetical protein FACS1894191_8740 [Clostridia bacterium]